MIAHKITNLKQRKTMKITTFITLSAAYLASSVSGYESILDDEPESSNLRNQRGLGWWKDESYYRSIYYRCCNVDEDANNVEGSPGRDNPDWRRDDAAANGYADGLCKCPKRGSSSSFWSSKSYFEKWQDACKPGGSIYRKANIGGGD